MAQLDEDTIAKIRSKRAEGMLIKDIAEELGVSKSCVHKYSKGTKGRAPAKPAEGGGDSEGEGGDSAELLAWYEAREKELLELVEKLTKRLMGAMDTIETLQQGAEG